MTMHHDYSELNENALSTSRFLVGFANPTRLRILCRLLDGECSVGDMAEWLNISQSALSQHLAKLRELQLVATRRHRQTIFYSAASPHIELLLSTLNGLRLPKAEIQDINIGGYPRHA